ncbi:MAG: cytochrome c family protein [Pseudomonadota bacterium]
MRFDFQTMNMVAGTLLGALFVFLLLGFFSEKALHSGGHHSDTLAFAMIEPGSSGAGGGSDAAIEEPVEEIIDYVALIASADAANGKGIFRQCGGCHKLDDGANGVGPHLYGVVGRTIGSVSGFSYSDALGGRDDAWTLDSLAGFLAAPSDWAPGTRMAYRGISDPQDRVDVIVYLNEAGESGIDLSATPE